MNHPGMQKIMKAIVNVMTRSSILEFSISDSIESVKKQFFFFFFHRLLVASG
jgi:hypothetical protein